MSASSYEIRLCQNPDCGLRYPLTDEDPFDKVQGRQFGVRCPACLGETQVVLTRDISPHPTPISNGERGNLAALLDNIRSAWNVGAIFRTADGLGVPKLYLCGITPTPENKSVRKTSLGAEKTVKWEHSLNAVETVKRLKDKGFKIIALEQDSCAIPINQCPIPNSQAAAIILGNEVTGVDPELLDLCDQIVHIPMHGEKRSLNVEVAFGIAVSHLLHV